MVVRLGTDAPDTLIGGETADFVSGLLGNDIFRLGNGIDATEGWFGDDTFYVGTGHSLISGGQGFDTVNLAAGQWIITPQAGFGYVGLVNLVTGQTVVLTGVERLNLGTVATNFVTGTAAANVINGVGTADYIHGGAGNDRIVSNGGNDWVSGGRGADTIITGDGNDVVDESYAEIGRLPNVLETNIIDTGTGNDIVQLATGTNGKLKYQIQGGVGVDVVYAGDVSLTFAVSGANTTMGTGYPGTPTTNFATLGGVEQVIAADGTAYTLRGSTWSTARNQITTGSGTVLAEDIRGGVGNDTLRGGGGVDRFYGGAGIDTVVLDGRAEHFAQSVYFTPDGLIRMHNPTSDVTPFVSLARDIERITFTNGAGTADDVTYNLKVLMTTSAVGATSTGHDFIVVNQATTGLAPSTVLLLNTGDDIVIGQGNITRVDGGVGNDIITWYNASANSSFLGGTGNDTMVVSRYAPQTASTIVVDGGIGNDNISYDGYGISRLIGGDGDDRISGNLNSVMLGGAGNDAFVLDFSRQSGVAIGSIDGGTGDDMIQLGFSVDIFVTKTATGFTVTDKYSGVSYNVTGVEGVKFLDMPVDARVAFTTYRGDGLVNTRTGGAGVDLMHGGANNDTLNGGAGNDSLAGDAGNDTLIGGIGNDTIHGGAGNDVLTGGTGLDIFLYRFGDQHDRITDFQAGAALGDVIGLQLDPMVTFEDVMTSARQVGVNVVLTFSPTDSLTLNNVNLSSLVANDFYFF